MKNCSNCHYYRVFYTKGYSQFRKETQGKCLKHSKPAKDKEVCSHWESNKTISSLRKFVCYDIVDGMSYDLNEIIQIIKEELEEDKKAAESDG